ncbi:polyprenyl diphosphate synthase [Lacimicrobium alkaliphilum]|uniref:Ditrans,polycis-undecaprenyl-diphosphate synthase ((2E,6E)-farnesyl-diphosphate specific) n=1 Tax=Lacimicrobium alkaliphilum TaxID=1526571 RepID=A0ABQ1R3G8_9ALTE|nr:polyprenyl diphosphate synthase [Lacimicrobium alkaliphilum]GGD56922.1 ditrans,polycis-undecaprenyl-diphosphate synthase ((2E,6E)-farnesyl-diphosphate specific) [Lacimicrobium alkaliphilum]
MTANSAIPKHVAIIMDGNGRWAKQRGKIRTFGHKAGVESVRNAVSFARKQGIEALTLFAFSSENWNRPAEEVGVLMELFNLVLKSEVKKLHKNDVRLKVVGDTERFDDKLIERIRAAEKLTADNKSLVLNIAANYGGRWDIVRAARLCAEKVRAGQLEAGDIDESTFYSHICLSSLPELDLLIRTGGESRVSNFLLWQLAYSELYFTPTLWPDFNEHEFSQAISDFAARQRRFGMTSEQVEV